MTVVAERATPAPFSCLAVIGAGLIGVSLARAAQRAGLVAEIRLWDVDPAVRARAAALDLGPGDSGVLDPGPGDRGVLDPGVAVPETLAAAVAGADLVAICTPVGAMLEVGEALAPHLAAGAVVTDTGSVKQAVIRDLGPALPAPVHFVPGHPVAGTEKSGPEAGFAELFDRRWVLLTPPAGTDESATARLERFWAGCGARTARMTAEHHDKVLGLTSHLPHLIAYTIVGTATDLEADLREEVITYSAGGFRDFTRIAASDPVMWRDIFLDNREAVLEMLQRFTEDLSALQRAIRWGEGDRLEDLFRRTREIRRSIEQAGQLD